MPKMQASSQDDKNSDLKNMLDAIISSQGDLELNREIVDGLESMKPLPKVAPLKLPSREETKKAKIISYEKTGNSAVCVTDRLKIEASEEDIERLRQAINTVAQFENIVLSEFRGHRGYSANDARYSDTFKEIYFWFKDGFIMASIRTGSVG